VAENAATVWKPRATRAAQPNERQTRGNLYFYSASAGDPGRSAIATDSNDLAGPACANIRIEPLSDFRRWSSIELKEAGFQRGGEGSVEKVWQWCRPTIGGKPTKLTL